MAMETAKADAKLPGWLVVSEPRPLSLAWVQGQVKVRATNGHFGHLVIFKRLPESGH